MTQTCQESWTPAWVCRAQWASKASSAHPEAACGFSFKQKGYGAYRPFFARIRATDATGGFRSRSVQTSSSAKLLYISRKASVSRRSSREVARSGSRLLETPRQKPLKPSWLEESRKQQKHLNHPKPVNPSTNSNPANLSPAIPGKL